MAIEKIIKRKIILTLLDPKKLEKDDIYFVLRYGGKDTVGAEVISKEPFKYKKGDEVIIVKPYKGKCKMETSIYSQESGFWLVNCYPILNSLIEENNLEVVYEQLFKQALEFKRIIDSVKDSSEQLEDRLS